MNIPKHRLELPPEADHLHAKPPRKPSKRRIRKQGGQEGHKRHLRELVPIEQCEAVTPCVPESCRRCGGLVRPDESQPIGHYHDSGTHDSGTVPAKTQDSGTVPAKTRGQSPS